MEKKNNLVCKWNSEKSGLKFWLLQHSGKYIESPKETVSNIWKTPAFKKLKSPYLIIYYLGLDKLFTSFRERIQFISYVHGSLIWISILEKLRPNKETWAFANKIENAFHSQDYKYDWLDWQKSQRNSWPTAKNLLSNCWATAE